MAMLIDISHHVLSQKADASHLQPSKGDILAKQGNFEHPITYNLKSEQFALGNFNQSVTMPQFDGADTEDDISNIAPAIEELQGADDVLISEAVLEDHGVRLHFPTTSCRIGIVAVPQISPISSQTHGKIERKRLVG